MATSIIILTREDLATPNKDVNIVGIDILSFSSKALDLIREADVVVFHDYGQHIKVLKFRDGDSGVEVNVRGFLKILGFPDTVTY